MAMGQIYGKTLWQLCSCNRIRELWRFIRCNPLRSNDLPWRIGLGWALGKAAGP